MEESKVVDDEAKKQNSPSVCWLVNDETSPSDVYVHIISPEFWSELTIITYFFVFIVTCVHQYEVVDLIFIVKGWLCTLTTLDSRIINVLTCFS